MHCRSSCCIVGEWLLLSNLKLGHVFEGLVVCSSHSSLPLINFLHSHIYFVVYVQDCDGAPLGWDHSSGWKCLPSRPIYKAGQNHRGGLQVQIVSRLKMFCACQVTERVEWALCRAKALGVWLVLTLQGKQRCCTLFWCIFTFPLNKDYILMNLLHGRFFYNLGCSPRFWKHWFKHIKAQPSLI